MAQLSFVVFSQQEELAREIRRGIDETGHARVAALVSNPDELVRTLRSCRADALFADLGMAPDGVLDLLNTIPAPRPLLLVSGPQDDSEIILRAMKQGAREFFPSIPDLHEIREVLDRLLLGSEPICPASRIAPLVAVMGAKGGVGATTVACQLAASLQEFDAPTAVVDLDIPLGDVSVHFGVNPPHTIANVAREAERLDRTYLLDVLQSHGSGVQILAGPTQVSDGRKIRGAEVDRALDLLRQEFDWVVVDVSRAWTDISEHILSLADQVLLITLLDVPTLNRARRHLEFLTKTSRSESRIHVVISRHKKSNGILESDVVEFLGAAPSAHIPHDYLITSRCLDQGRTVGEVSPGGSLHRAYQRLAQNVCIWSGLEPPAIQPVSLMTRVRGVLWEGSRWH